MATSKTTPSTRPSTSAWRRHLHRADLDAALTHQGEEAVQVGRLGGGQCGLDVGARHAGADGADDRAGDADGFEPVLEQSRRGRLALRAGHADHLHRGRRLAVDPGRHLAEHTPEVVDDDRRGVGRQPYGARWIGEDPDGTGVQRGRREVGSVRAGARQCGVQVPRLDALGAQRDAGDVSGRRAHEPNRRDRLEPGREVAERRRGGRRGSPGESLVIT